MNQTQLSEHFLVLLKKKNSGGWGRREEKEREDITANQQVPKSPTKLENVGRCRGKRCWEEGRATGSELLERWGHPGDFMAVT